jgi:hypothetical protein
MDKLFSFQKRDDDINMLLTKYNLFREEVNTDCSLFVDAQNHMNGKLYMRRSSLKYTTKTDFFTESHWKFNICSIKTDSVEEEQKSEIEKFLLQKSRENECGHTITDLTISWVHGFILVNKNQWIVKMAHYLEIDVTVQSVHF